MRYISQTSAVHHISVSLCFPHFNLDFLSSRETTHRSTTCFTGLKTTGWQSVEDPVSRVVCRGKPDRYAVFYFATATIIAVLAHPPWPTTYYRGRQRRTFLRRCVLSLKFPYARNVSWPCKLRERINNARARKIGL